MCTTDDLKRCGQCGASSPDRRAICDLCATPFETRRASMVAALATAPLIAIGYALAVGSGSFVAIVLFAAFAPAVTASIAPQTRAVTVASGIVLGSAVATLVAPWLAKELAARMEASHLHWALTWLVLNAASAGLAATCTVIVHHIRSVEYNR